MAYRLIRTLEDRLIRKLQTIDAGVKQNNRLANQSFALHFFHRICFSLPHPNSADQSHRPIVRQVRDFGDRLGDQVVSFRDKLERVERELAGMLGRITSAAQKSGKSRVYRVRFECGNW